MDIDVDGVRVHNEMMYAKEDYQKLAESLYCTHHKMRQWEAVSRQGFQLIL